MSDYYFEDYKEVHGGLFETIDVALGDPRDAAFARDLAQGARAILDMHLSEEEIDELVYGMGCLLYIPAHPDTTYASWLMEIERRSLIRARILETS